VDLIFSQKLIVMPADWVGFGALGNWADCSVIIELVFATMAGFVLVLVLVVVVPQKPTTFCAFE